MIVMEFSAGAVERFHLLHYGLALILIFVGLKMVWLNDAFGGKFPVTWSLAIIAGAIGTSIIASLLFPAKAKGSDAGKLASPASLPEAAE